MGSATECTAKPIAMENRDRRTLITMIKSLWNNKKKEKTKVDKKENTHEKLNGSPTQHKRIETVETQENVNPVAALLENFSRLELEKRKEREDTKVRDDTREQNELDNFAFKVIEDHSKERMSSQSSEDSGYSENNDKTESADKTDSVDRTDNADGTDEVIVGLENLDLDVDKKKKKTFKTIVLSRGPTRTNICRYGASPRRPYPAHDSDSFRQSQINQINKHTLTGGQVIVNQCPPQDSFVEVDIACQVVGSQAQYLRDQEGYLQDVLEYIEEDTTKVATVPCVPDSMATPEYTLQDVVKSSLSDYEALERTTENEFIQLIQEIQEGRDSMPQSNPIDQLLNNSLIGRDDINCIFNYVERELNSNDGCLFPSPPCSENVPSPMLESPSFYATNSDYTLSPEPSPVYNSDCEKYQEIPNFEEEKSTEDNSDKKPRERTSSSSCMTMKQYKDLQKEIASDFSKKECCQGSRRTCKEIFQEYLEKLERDERKSLCSQVTKLDLKMSYGVLHNILLGLSRGAEHEARQYVLFALICEGILAMEPKLFTGDVGLSLLKAAALRCPHRPLLTRYVVQCVRTAIKSDPAPYAGKDCVFHEVDALGDSLVGACARAGDIAAAALAELVRAHADQPPLFRVQHANGEGYTALHVACSQHSSASPRLHVVHVLLDHAGADIWKGDLKGGDTVLHLAVNSANCDLRLIMLLFKHVDRKMWKALAHLQNMSSLTPIDHARSATKSSTRPNYPPEVLDFLKKCR